MRTIRKLAILPLVAAALAFAPAPPRHAPHDAPDGESGSALRQERDLRPVDKVIAFDSKIHDFGDVLIPDGPVSHTFTFRNIDDRPFTVVNVISSCGCTSPVWTREEIPPQGEGTIEVTFTNDQGPFPFDKTLTVYISTASRSEVLRVRGVAYEKFPKLHERFPRRIGRLGFRDYYFQMGYVEKGRVKSDRITFANLSSQPIEVVPVDPSPGLKVTVEPKVVQPKGTAKLNITIDSSLAGEVWGKSTFTVRLSTGGQVYPVPITVNAFIKDDFSEWTREMIENGGVPSLSTSYHEFGEIEAGEKITFSCTVKNTGKSDLILRSADTGRDDITMHNRLPVTLRIGESVELRFTAETASRSGEVLDVISILSNSPSKTIINLFLAGFIKENGNKR